MLTCAEVPGLRYAWNAWCISTILRPFYLLCKIFAIFTASSRVFCLSKMSLVTVFCLENEDFMTISFTHEGKQRKMQRPKAEPLEKCLNRMTLSIQNDKKDKKKKQKAIENSIPSSCVSLWNQGGKINEDTANIEAWKDGCELRIGERSLKVEVNPPAIARLSLPSHIMANFPISPKMELQFADVNHCIFEWFRSRIPSGGSASANPSMQTEWEKVGSDCFYKPSVSDIGCYIKLVCTAGRCNKVSSIKSEVTSCIKVSAAPGICPFENRHLYTSKKLGTESFRLACYNILADMYARKDFALNFLYPYCPPYALDIGYRHQILLKELTGYNADVLCLQECGLQTFDGFLKQSMEMLGYQGMVKSKAGGVPEGEAIFFDTDKFEFVSSHDIVLKESLLEDPINEELLQHLSSIPACLENVLEKNTVAQIALLKDKRKLSHHLCIVNTHLYFKPNSPHIRLIQAAIILNQIKKVVDSFSESELGNNKKIAVLFCGDFNSLLKSALVQLVLNGNVPADHQDWVTIEEEDQHCTTMNLSHDFHLFSACGNLSFTVFTSGFRNTLDYIFCDSQQIEVDAVIPMPSEEELSLHTAIPSVVMPSDHLALVCDLKWKE